MRFKHKMPALSFHTDFGQGLLCFPDEDKGPMTGVNSQNAMSVPLGTKPQFKFISKFVIKSKMLSIVPELRLTMFIYFSMYTCLFCDPDL